MPSVPGYPPGSGLLGLGDGMGLTLLQCSTAAGSGGAEAWGGERVAWGSAGTVSAPAATPSLSLCHPHHPHPGPGSQGSPGQRGSQRGTDGDAAQQDAGWLNRSGKNLGKWWRLAGS